MCGIAGLFDPRRTPDEATLAAMSGCLTHRGPDDDGIHIDGSIGLAHRRLSIIDLETGRQPIFNEDESVCVVFNGEIYNYRELRESLSSAGHTFTTETDTEVLVHLYEEGGPAFVERLRGMFAFALWDADAERLVLARDPMGIKPLLLAQDGDRVAFASELPALLETDLDHGGLDRAALARYFGFGFVPAPRTAFRNIRKLEPGELATVTAAGIERTSFHTPTVQSSTVGLNGAAEAVRERVETAVERRLQSDVPLGAFLSGGIDSSIVVGVLAELLDDPVNTFTVGFDADLFDESQAAREVAEYHDTAHTEFTITPADVRETIPEVLGQLGEPFGDQSLIPTYVVARETARDITVALSGDGADELFAGYDRYRGEFFSRYYRLLPAPLRRYAVEPAVGTMPVSRATGLGELARKAQKFTRGGVGDSAARHVEWMRVPDDAAAETVSPDPIAAGRTDLDAEHRDVRTWLPADRRNSLWEMQAVDVRYTLPSQMLRKVDAASMYNSLEVRVPFLGTDVVEYAMELPTGQKMTLRNRKRVLKRAFEDVLPSTTVERDKQGFDMPVGEWFKNELAAEFHDVVAGLETDVLDVDGVLAVYDEHAHGKSEHGKFLWTVYVFAVWLRRMRREGVLPPP
jgi:asparagine synthase (glutamine-hydrolysing)